MANGLAIAELGFQDIAIGAVFDCERTFTAVDLERFAEVSGDFSSLHMDAEYAEATPFLGRVVHGMLLGALFSQLVGMRIPGRHALYLGQDLSFRLPVRLGETIRASAKVTAKTEATRTIVLATVIRNAQGKVAVSGTARVRVRDSDPTVGSACAPVGGQAVDRSIIRKVALVTGGSRGIGAAVARLLGPQYPGRHSWRFKTRSWTSPVAGSSWPWPARTTRAMSGKSSP